MIPVSKIVRIDAKSEPMLSIPEYIILRNKTLRQIRRVARENPGVWILPVCFGGVEDVPDYSGFLRRKRPEDFYVAQPIYVGSAELPADTLAKFASVIFGDDAIERKP